MPLTKKGQKIMSSMREEYGPKKGKEVFYASANKGTISGVHEGKKSHPTGEKHCQHCRETGVLHKGK